MKTRDLIIPLIVFFAFLLVGRWTGGLIQRSVLASGQIEEEKMLADATRFDQPSFSNGPFAPLPLEDSLPDPIGEDESDFSRQKNLLIVGVDDLTKPQPILAGIWLALYLPNMPLVTLMPIYPEVFAQPDQLQFTADADLSKSFRLNPDGFPHPDFLNSLEEKGLWWTNIAVLDRTALESLHHFTSSSNTNNRSDMKHEATIGNEPAKQNPVNEPQAVLLFQAHTIQEMCHTNNLKISARQIAHVIESLEGHLATDISAGEVVSELKSMLFYGGGFICEFPSLTLDSGSL